VKYRTIVADPPWDYGDVPWGASSMAPGQAFLPYSTMSVEEIAALSVRQACAKGGAHLYLWTTQRFLRDAYWIAEAWGFRPICLLVWCKQPRAGLPGTFKSTVEFVVFARRGGLAAKGWSDRQWFAWPRGEHSQKPEAFMDLVEQVSPGPYLEMFSRRARLGWDTWGDEALGGNGVEPQQSHLPGTPLVTA
jgi:N6-adenosine-specific RNA methylase IME4